MEALATRFCVFLPFMVLSEAFSVSHTNFYCGAFRSPLLFPLTSSSSSSSSCQGRQNGLVVLTSSMDAATMGDFLREDQLEGEEEDMWTMEDLDMMEDDGSVVFEDNDDNGEWVPDAVKAAQRRKPTHLRPANEVIAPSTMEDEEQDEIPFNTRPSPYTDEEEELIDALGGKYAVATSGPRREEGFLGDCTLAEIAMDYSVPICYLADVLCMWGVPVPINIHDRLGDLVTGEQAFALVEAVNSLDIGVLQDRYSNFSLLQLCAEFDIELREAFEFAMKEGWSLPFGVRTNLRVEQEEELLRLFSDVYRG